MHPTREGPQHATGVCGVRWFSETLNSVPHDCVGGNDCLSWLDVLAGCKDVVCLSGCKAANKFFWRLVRQGSFVDIGWNDPRVKANLSKQLDASR